MAEAVKPLKGLKAATRRWFVDVCTRWVLEEHHVKLLVVAARAFDEAEAAASIIRRDGIVLETRTGFRRPHPAIRIHNEASPCSCA